MVNNESSLLNNTPKNEEITSNADLEQPQGNDSDSDSEGGYEDRLGNYTLLSQHPIDGDLIYDSDSVDTDTEEQNDNDSGNTASGVSTIPVPDIVPSDIEILEDVWAQPGPIEVDIDMTQKKIDLVKEVMLNVQLPNESIPDWAKNVPEQEWKEHLLKKLNKK
ncbi:uncharacterized protein LOC143204778 [Rhynchophorus ferrugineus]|uniref:Male-enhanced antigen 1 n=1 Tax=Rhynchophorus ferrugineus TaxID=354439 RepID=A0A834MM55_RHYFE|nr:hypothetical protein GWI33_000202 [Rhynchophorus ferrugineus]